MTLFGFDITRSERKADLSLDQFIANLDAMYQTISGIQVTPETAMQSPTVQAIIKAVSGRIAILPIHLYEKGTSRDRATKKPLPDHPVAKLLSLPKAEGVDRVSFWLDATSWLVRYGNFYAVKGRGQTGPIRKLFALPPWRVTPEQQDDFRVVYRIARQSGSAREYAASEILHARGASRNGYHGDSPIMDARESIALEIAAEKFGGSYFGNGAMPGLVFQYMAQSGGHTNDEQRKRMILEFMQSFSGKGRFKAIFLPKGIEMADPVNLDNDKAQFLQTRQYQRTVIAGALGVPPHLVGDLQKATYNNVEQQSLDFVYTVILPYVRCFEAAMERDLLTDEDRSRGVIIRFNLDAALRGDFKTRQEGLNIQRQAGVISANEWREHEGMNPRKGGDTYYEQGPSGQTPQPSREPESEPEDDPAMAVAGNGNGKSWW